MNGFSNRVEFMIVSLATSFIGVSILAWIGAIPPQNLRDGFRVPEWEAFRDNDGIPVLAGMVVILLFAQIRRLNHIGWSRMWIVMAFIPLANMAYLAALALIPGNALSKKALRAQNKLAVRTMASEPPPVIDDVPSGSTIEVNGQELLLPNEADAQHAS
ncbi:MAG: DUF805 domain-containing protein [Acidimicrobiales bacterium]|nr:DUF805 domain-containing protein [Acidimicrobiales bacterium]